MKNKSSLCSLCLMPIFPSQKYAFVCQKMGCDGKESLASDAFSYPYYWVVFHLDCLKGEMPLTDAYA